MKKLIIFLMFLMWAGCETTEQHSFKWEGVYDTVSFKVIELDSTTEWVGDLYNTSKYVVDSNGILNFVEGDENLNNPYHCIYDLETKVLVEYNWNTRSWDTVYFCSERGHIRPSVYESTCMYCPDRYEEYADSTVLVSPGCNYITYTCLRCGKKITEKIPDTRTVIWRRVK